MIGTPRKALKASSVSPETKKKRSCSPASSKFTGSARSATSPTRPSLGFSETLPTISGFSPSLAARLKLPVARSRR